MSNLYYSQRRNVSVQLPDENVGWHFWTAFTSYISSLAEKNWFCKHFAGECVDGGPCGWDQTKVTECVAQELGFGDWPKYFQLLPNNDTLLDMVEFFYRHVAIPQKQWYHDFCRNWHPENEDYDVVGARDKYTVWVNERFKRFNHPYVLRKGRIGQVTEPLLDAPVFLTRLQTKDDHLRKLWGQAIENFYDRTGAKKLEGLKSIVDAFDRLKTLEGGDKKQSITAVIRKIVGNDEVACHFDFIFKNLTDLSNKYTIRHHEIDKHIIQDEEIIDYLFYVFMASARLIVKKYKLCD